MPAGNPAPPRPRSPEAFISATICSGVISVRALAAPKYPSRAIYSSMDSGVDVALVAKGPGHLMGEEGNVFLFEDLLAVCGVFVQKPLNGLAVDQVGLDHLGDILGGELLVKTPLRAEPP